MSYEDDINAMNQTIANYNNWQASQASLALAEDDLEFGKEAFAQQMSLANQQFDWNQRVAERNYEWQKTQWEYQKELNNLAMQREDTAYSRAVQDLKNAGLSPLMLSSGAAAQVLNSGVAPQYDVNGVNTAYGAKQDALERRRQQINENRQYRFQQKQANRQLGLQTASMALQVEKQTQDLINSIYDNRQKKQQTERLEHENKYYRAHGYQNVTLATVLSDFLNRDSTKQLLSQMGEGYDKLASAIGKFADKVSTSISDSGKIDFNRDEVFSYFKNQGLSDDSSNILADNVREMYDSWNNMSLAEKAKVSWSSHVEMFFAKLKDLLSELK